MKFRKKPVVIDAIQWKGNNLEEINKFVSWNPADLELAIHTLEGIMTASCGDWIIRGVKGEFYPCKPDIFAATYEAVL